VRLASQWIERGGFPRLAATSVQSHRASDGRPAKRRASILHKKLNPQPGAFARPTTTVQENGAMSPVRTRAQWAKHIRAEHKAMATACITAIIKLGRVLLAAKRSLGHGEFLAMIESDLTFGARPAQMLMKIATDKRLQKAKHGSHLPQAWTVLHALSKLSDEDFDSGISTGVIHPQMTRDAATKYRVQVTTSHQTHRIAAPFTIVKAADQPTRTVHIVPMGLLAKLEQLEKVASDLSMMNIDADSAEARRIRKTRACDSW
jgi:hypothetical protein